MTEPAVSNHADAFLGQSFRILLSRPDAVRASRPFNHPDVSWVACDLGGDCLRMAASERPDLVLIQPDNLIGTAIQLCRSLRSEEPANAIRIAVWSVNLAKPERLEFYRAGADDVVTDHEIGSEAIMRLTSDARRSLFDKPNLTYSDLVLFPDRHIAWRRGKSVPLSRFQIQLLQFFMENPQTMLTRSDLAASVWKDDPVHDGSISTAVNRLRHLISLPDAPDLIHTVRGRGYILQSR